MIYILSGIAIVLICALAGALIYTAIVENGEPK